MTIIYVTKGCLTSGVVKKIDAVEQNSYPGMFLIGGVRIKTYVHKGDYYFAEQEALERAKVLRDKKIASLKKQIAKLESCTFGGACE